MSRREDIDTSFWDDEDVVALSPNAKLAYLWAFTNHRCNMAGLYKVAPRTAAFETGLTQSQVDKALAELQAARFVYAVDGVLWVRTRVKHLRTTHVNVAKSIVSHVEKIGRDHPLSEAFLAEYAHTDWLLKTEPFRTLTEPSSNGSANPLREVA
jgi:hypothetical protein